MIEDTGFVGSGTTGGSGDLCSGRVPSCPSPRIGDGEDNVDDEVDTVGDIFCEKKELLRGEDSFFSGEPGGVVVSDPVPTNTLHKEGESHVDIVFLLLDGSNDSCETLLFIRFYFNF